MLSGNKILLVVSGGIAAYKTPHPVRLLRKAGARVRCVLTRGGAQFTTALSLGAVSEETVHEALFDLTAESEMGHIQLSRDADLLLVAPATAHIMARLAGGLADDLATTLLLATDKPVVMAPAMNVRMWEHAATQDNLARLTARGVRFIGPEEGDMACGEFGMGRMSEPEAIVAALETMLSDDRPLAGRRALVTSGPTHEPIDPVRYIANRSSGRQGHAIAGALARLGAETILVSGPTQQPTPPDVRLVPVESARDMLAACLDALPVDLAVCAAAVADWRVDQVSGQKMKKDGTGQPPALHLVENPDILAHLSGLNENRPPLVVGFAAETEQVIENAKAKRLRKACDWILANDVSPDQGVFGGESNTIHLVDGNGVESWPTLGKDQVAERLARRVADHLEGRS